MTALKMRPAFIALLAAPMRRTHIIEEKDRRPLAAMVVAVAIIYVLAVILLGSPGIETILGVVVGVILATIAVLAILFWHTHRKRS